MLNKQFIIKLLYIHYNVINFLFICKTNQHRKELINKDFITSIVTTLSNISVKNINKFENF